MPYDNPKVEAAITAAHLSPPDASLVRKYARSVSDARGLIQRLRELDQKKRPVDTSHVPQ